MFFSKLVRLELETFMMGIFKLRYCLFKIAGWGNALRDDQFYIETVFFCRLQPMLSNMIESRKQYMRRCHRQVVTPQHFAFSLPMLNDLNGTMLVWQTLLTMKVSTFIHPGRETSRASHERRRLWLSWDGCDQSFSSFILACKASHLLSKNSQTSKPSIPFMQVSTLIDTSLEELRKRHQWI